jgi:hypothetical protein
MLNFDGFTKMEILVRKQAKRRVTTLIHGLILFRFWKLSSFLSGAGLSWEANRRRPGHHPITHSLTYRKQTKNNLNKPLDSQLSSTLRWMQSDYQQQIAKLQWKGISGYLTT